MSTLKCQCEKTPALSSVSTFSPKLNMNPMYKTDLFLTNNYNLNI